MRLMINMSFGQINYFSITDILGNVTLGYVICLLFGRIKMWKICIHYFLIFLNDCSSDFYGNYKNNRIFNTIYVNKYF